MIDLYVANNTNYEMNGNMELLPSSCITSAEINGVWSLSMTHPIDEEGRWKEITEGAVLKVQSFNGSQLFRIKKVQKQDSGIQVIGEPIFLDSIGDCFVYDKRPTNATCEQALNTILSSNAKYSASSNITKRATAYYVLKNAMECIASTEENSVLNRWGGEIEYNNYEIILNERLGTDNGVELLYGKNIPTNGMRETISIEDVVTRVVPKGFNGRLISTGNKYVDSPLIGNYPTIVTKVIEFSNIKLKDDLEGDAAEGDIICDTIAELNQALRTAAEHEFSDGNIDKPLISIECDMVLLQNTEEYKDFANLENVSLGDVIHCNHSRLGIKADARINALTWNCITESVENVTIGSIMPTYISKVESLVTEIASSAANTAVNSQTQEDIFNKLTHNGETQGIYLQDGRIYINGTYIKSGTVDADLVKAGIIRDRQNKNYWNLDTGEFALSAQTKVGGQTVNQIANNAVDSQTQADIFNKLTKGGTSQGIYLSDGQLYINGTYIQTGELNADLITAGILRDAKGENYWDLALGKIVAHNIEVTGDIKSGSTIQGSTIQGSNIAGSVIGTSGEDSDFNYTSKLENGEIIFERVGKSSSQYDGTISIKGGSLIADFDTADSKTTVTNVIRVESKSTERSASMLPGSISVRQDANNYVRISTSNIEIYVNGQKVWSAR